MQLGEALEIERGLWQDDAGALTLGQLENRSAKSRVGARGHGLEHVAVKTPDVLLAQIGSDETHRAFAILLQRPQKSSRAGRTDSRNEDRERLGHRSRLSLRRCSSR